LEDFPEISRTVEQVKKKLGEEGRLLIRPSGTEPVIRVMIEGKDQDRVVQLTEETAAVIGRVMS
jgi:phosphoglucosamine mutase